MLERAGLYLPYCILDLSQENLWDLSLPLTAEALKMQGALNICDSYVLKEDLSSASPTRLSVDVESRLGCSIVWRVGVSIANIQIGILTLISRYDDNVRALTCLQGPQAMPLVQLGNLNLSLCGLCTIHELTRC